MQPIDPDYFRQKSQELGLDRADTLARAQTKLDQLYPGRTRAVSLNRGTLKIVTESAPIAGELRLRQLEIQAISADIERLQIVIG